MVKTDNDLPDEKKGKCNLDMDYILLAFCIIYGAYKNRKMFFFIYLTS